jgi:hypothetical protein
MRTSTARCRAPDALEPVPQHAQQLDRMARDLANPVEGRWPPSASLKRPSRRACALRTPSVAEESPEIVSRQRRAVHRDERSVSAWRRFVQRSASRPLARAGPAGQEHGGAGRATSAISRQHRAAWRRFLRRARRATAREVRPREPSLRPARARDRTGTARRSRPPRPPPDTTPPSCAPHRLGDGPRSGRFGTSGRSRRAASSCARLSPPGGPCGDHDAWRVGPKALSANTRSTPPAITRPRRE